MAANNKIKIFKIASEINIGIGAIVEFLQNKGYDIQNKPTSTITEEMANLVYDKFKREKIAAEKQREKLEKHHILRNTPEHDHKTESNEEVAVKEVVPEVPKQTEPPKPVEPIQEKPTLKILDKIDLTREPKPEVIDKKEDKPIQEKKAEPEVKIIEAQTNEVKQESAEPKQKAEPAPKQEVTKPEPTERKIEQVSQVEAKREGKKPKDENLKQHKTEKGPEHKKQDNSNKQSPKATEDTPSSEVKPTDKNRETGEKHKKKHKKIAEEVITASPKLQGLTILGKIDLEKPKPHRSDDRGNRGRGPGTDNRGDNRGRDDSGASGGRRREDNRGGYQRREDNRSGTPRQDDGRSGGYVRRDDNRTDSRPQGERRDDRNTSGNFRSNENRPAAEGGNYRSSGDNRFANRARTSGFIRPADPIIDTNTSKLNKDVKFKKTSTEEETTKVIARVKPKEKSKSKEDKQVKKHKKLIREQISSLDIDKAVRETMAEIDLQHSTGGSRSKIKQKKKMEREERDTIRQRVEDEMANVLELTEFVTTGELAKAMNILPNQIIVKCMQLGLMVTINQRLDKDTIALIAEDFGYSVNFYNEQESLEIEEEIDTEESLEFRPPIVTIMGHVDHGKTSLLDYIRSSNVVAGEAGGITQHIGAYQVELDNGKMITFLDTPGHAAFTAMRARGAQVTDIVILVVAADDSVMPQTIEAISHAKAAGVPIIVAINKIDKPDANPDRIKQQLSDHGILIEEWGGKYQSIEISAKFGKNIDVLLDKVLIEAELLNLRANPNKKARGTVIEAVMKKGFGPVATVIIQGGTLKIGDPFVAGTASGRVKAMLDEREKRVDLAEPASPVLVVGFDTLPEAGDNFTVLNTDMEARQVAKERDILKRELSLRQIRKISLDDISQKIHEGNVKELKLILKGDVAGSVEALGESLLKLSNEEVRVLIIHKGVGTILETDVILASASEAVIVGFNVPVDVNARKLADVEKVDIRNYNIIYDCINEVHMALEGLLSPEYHEETTAMLEVRRTFKISRMGTIAGCYVQNGKISKNDKVKVIRDGLILHTGTLSSLKREKDDVKEVDAGFECGVMINNFNSLEVGDHIESFKIIEVKRKLS